MAPVDVSPNGEVLAQTITTVRGTTPPVVERTQEQVCWYDGKGRPGPVVARFPGQLWYRGPDTKLSVIGLTIPTQLVAADGGWYAGDPDTPTLRRYRRDGELEQVIIIRSPPHPITEADLGRERARAQEALADRYRQLEGRSIPPGLKALIRDEYALLDEMPYPTTFPPYEGLLVDAARHVWVRRYRRPGADDPNEFWVIDPDGRWLGTVELPRELRVFEIGTDYVLGVRKDDLDIEYVELYPLYRQ